MDVAEKSSFDRPMNDVRSDTKSTFRLHYFPKIPIAPATEKGGEAQQGTDFRRTDCRESAAAESIIFERSDSDGISDQSLKNGNTGPVEKAYTKGYRDGQAAAIKAGEERLESHLAHLHKLISQIEETRTEVFRSAEKEIVTLAMAIATKIVRHEISIKDDVVLRVVDEALRKCVDHERIKIRVNPSDYLFLREKTSELSSLMDKPGNLNFVEDETVERGGCLIETNLGDIDARIKKQLHVVEAALKSEFQKSNLTDNCRTQ